MQKEFEPNTSEYVFSCSIVGINMPLGIGLMTLKKGSIICFVLFCVGGGRFIAKISLAPSSDSD